MSRPNPRRAGAALLALGLAAALAPRADAQVFTGAGIATGVAMPNPPGDAAPAPVPQTPTELLRHLPSTLDGFDLVGESGELRWPVYLTKAQAASALRFRVGYVSAISILPEVSKLTVSVNGQPVGTEVIDAASGLRTVEFALPTGLASAGFNAVTLSVQQRHRVDCSVAATYELWTRIERAQTGLVLPADTQAIHDLADLPALLPRADGTLPIHVLLQGKTNPQQLARVVKATSAVALAAHALQPVVDFNANAADAFGLDIIVGPRAALAADPRVAASLESAGPLARILVPDNARHPTLVVTGDTDAEIDRAVASLLPNTRPIGSDAGVVALENYPGRRTRGGEALTLHDLDLRSEEVSGAFLRRSFNLALPADLLVSDYARGTLDLAGGYAAGLARGAQVRVDVNGKSSGVIKLPYAGGDMFRHNQLFLPLSLMRPGLNRIDVYAETPRPEDATCAATDAKRFLFSDTSKIVLPTLALVQRLPDLALVAAGGLPFVQGSPVLVVPSADRDSLGSALSIATRASVAAGKIIPFTFARRMPTDPTESVLVVAPARALDPALMRDVGLDPREVETAWRDVASRPPEAHDQSRWWLASTEGPAACRLPSTARTSLEAAASLRAAAPTDAPAPARTIAAESGDLLESWTEERHPSRTWLASLSSLSADAKAWVAAVPDAVSSRVRRAPQVDGIAPEASLILAQSMSRGSDRAVTTIVTAPTAALLHQSVACLFDPQVWTKVRGRLAVLDASRGSLTTTDAGSHHYVAGSSTSLSNERLVIAGWFSLEPAAFVAVAMLMALALSGTTLWFVRGVGRRSE